MLVLRRREGESVLIGADVEVRVLEVNGNRVTLGVTAPRAVTILRKEIHLTQEQNRLAALAPAPASLSALLQHLRR